MIFDPFTEEEGDVLTETVPEISKSIIVYNDDHNSFDHVIECFIKYCKHHPGQAEQCAMIIHNNGKCSVKVGDFDKLKPIKEALCDAGLSATIE